MLTRLRPFDFKGISHNNEQILVSNFGDITDPLFVYDQYHRIIRVNQSFTDLFEIPVKELIGRYCYEAIFHRTYKCDGCMVEDVFASGEPKTWEEQRTLPNGITLNFEVFASPIRNLKGMTALAFQQRRNITEQKRRESQHRISEEQYRTIVEIGRQGFFVLDADGVVTYCNDRLAEMLGYSSEQIKGRSIFKFIDDHTITSPQLNKNIENLLEKKELSFRKKNGNSVTVRISMSTCRKDSGHVALLAILTDITHLKELEEDYRTVKKFSERVVDSITDSLIIVDPSTHRIVQANDHFLSSMGVNANEVLQKTCYEIIHGRHNPCETYGISCPVRETALNNCPTIINRVYRDKAENEQLLQISAYPLHDSRGRVNRVIRIGHDITYKKTVQKAISSRRTELEKIHNQLRTLYDISTHLSTTESLSKLVEYIYKINKRVYPSSDFFFFIFNAERDGFCLLDVHDKPFIKPFQKLYAELEEKGQLTDFVTYLNKLQPHDVISIGSTKLPGPLKRITEDYATSFGLPVFFQSQSIGYFLVVSNPAQGYAIDDIHFFHALFGQLAGHIRQLVFREFENRAFICQSTKRKSYENIIGRSLAIQKVFHLIEQVANSDATVLITGENGTGKELVAQAIHRMGHRSNGPFVVANCSAFSSNLLESELFGHEKGAFTGALTRKKGRIELAHGGTLFLDEIGNISLDTQVLLLRFLQNHCFERVGGEQTIQADVRVLAATNSNLQQEVDAGRFRSDFFYRLNVVTIHLPPLRERKDDIPLLADHFLKNYSMMEGKKIEPFTLEIMQILINYDWPGNIRQLENAIHHAVILTQGDSIEKKELPAFLTQQSPHSITDSLVENERRLILRILQECEWNKHETARRLMINRSTLYSKINKYNLFSNEVYEN
jgi:PAS domain S-box-containing protein